MAGEAFQVICATQSSHKLAGQGLTALAADLAAALWLRGLHLLLVLERVGHGAHRAIGTVLRGEALRPGRGVGVGVGVEGFGGLSREAVGARVVGLALAVHGGRRRRRVHESSGWQQQLAGSSSSSSWRAACGGDGRAVRRVGAGAGAGVVWCGVAGEGWCRRVLCTESEDARPLGRVCRLAVAVEVKATTGDERRAACSSRGRQTTRVQLETLGGQTPPGQPGRRGTGTATRAAGWRAGRRRVGAGGGGGGGHWSEVRESSCWRCYEYERGTRGAPSGHSVVHALRFTRTPIALPPETAQAASGRNRATEGHTGPRLCTQCTATLGPDNDMGTVAQWHSAAQCRTLCRPCSARRRRGCKAARLRGCQAARLPGTGLPPARAAVDAGCRQALLPLVLARVT